MLHRAGLHQLSLVFVRNDRNGNYQRPDIWRCYGYL